MNRYYRTTIFLLALFSLVNASAQKNLSYGPKSSWVENVDFELDKEDSDEDPYTFLLFDNQENAILKEDYYHYAIRLNNSEGVQEMSKFSVDFDPSYQKLTLHKLTIHRGDSSENRSFGDVKVLQRETDLSRAMYNGTLTANKEIKDTRKGDVVEYSYTVTGYNPVYDGGRFLNLYQNYGVYIKRIYQVYITNKKQNLNYSLTAEKGKVTKNGNTWKYEWDLKSVEPIDENLNAPAWFEQINRVSFSTMNTWKDVVDWALKLYYLTPSDKSKLRSKIKPVLSLEGSERDILEAIRFVQDEVRYLGFEDGINAFKPHNPIQVFDQRFGDCKDKSLLMSAILQEMNIDAAPMLVHSTKGKSLIHRLASPIAFNHCIVIFNKDGEDYIVDPTASNQGGKLKNFAFPDYGYGLPIRADSDKLMPFEKQVAPLIIVDEEFILDSIGGSGSFTISTKYNGNQADVQRSYFGGNRRAEIKKTYTNYYQNYYEGIELDSLSIIDTSRNSINEVTTKEFYSIPELWKKEDDIYSFSIYSLTLNDVINLANHPDDNVPYYLGSPNEYIHTITVTLPEEWSIDPEEGSLKNDNFDYSYNISYFKNELTLKYRLYIKKSTIEVENLEEVIEDAKKIVDDLTYTLTYNTSLQKLDNKDNLVWQTWLMILIGLIIGVFLCKWMYFEYNPLPQNATKSISIGGWLILPAIGLFLTPFILTFQMVQLINEGTFNVSTFHYFLNADASENGIAILVIILLEGMFNIILLLWSITLIFLFVQRRSNVPRLIIALYIVSLLSVTIDGLALYFFMGEENPFDVDIVKTFIRAFIWIPYFLFSQRVKETFTVSLNKDII